LLFGIAFNETPFYVALYGALILAVGYVGRMLFASPPKRRNLLRFAAYGTAVVLPLVLPLILSVFAVAVDYQRIANTPASFPLRTLIGSYFLPVTSMESSFYVESMRGAWGTWEMNAYLGLGAVAFWMVGLVLHRPRWFHVALAGVFIFTIGNQYWWQPMHWAMLLPPFSSHQSFNRLRLFVQMFFAIGSAWGCAQLLCRHPGPSWKRRVIELAALVAAGEIAVTSYFIVRHSHYAYKLPEVTNARNGDFYQRSYRAPLPAFIDGWPADLARYTRANIGVVAEEAALPSQFRLRSAVKTVDGAGYIGEFTQNGLPVKPDYWSPNRISFSRLEPGTPLLINLNRGSPWHNFGRPLFPDDRIVEFGKPFVISPDANGRVELSYILSGQRSAWGWGVVALGLAVAFCIFV